MPELALKPTNPTRLATAVVGGVLIAAGSLAGLWRAFNAISVVILVPDLSGPVLFHYFVANGFDVLWCALMAVSGCLLITRNAKATTWLVAATVAWIPGTAVYLVQALRTPEFALQSLRMPAIVIALLFLVFRVIVLLPTVVGFLVARRLRAAL